MLSAFAIIGAISLVLSTVCGSARQEGFLWGGVGCLFIELVIQTIIKFY
jgi:hypothetical protein